MATEIEGQAYLDIEINTVYNEKHKIDIQSVLQFSHIQSINNLSDMAVIKFKDFGSLFTEILPLTGHETVNVKYGENSKNYNEAIFDIYSIESKPQSPIWAIVPGENKYTINSEVELVLVNKCILGLVAEQHNRTFRNKKYSDIASEIASSITNIKKTIIEESVGNYTVLQPYWTNAQLLRKIAKYARSSQCGACGYLYFVDRDTFHFHTYEKIYSSGHHEKMMIAKSTLGDDMQKDSSIKKMIDDGHYGISEIGYKINNHFYLSQGGFNSTSGGYDFETDDYIMGSSSIKSSKNNITSLGERFSVKTENIPSVGRFIYTGDKRQEQLDDVSETRHLWPFYDLVKCNVLARGKIDRKPATMIKIVMPSTSQTREIVDSFHSGLYFVDTVSHTIQMGGYYNRMVLSRNSYNSIKGSSGGFFEQPVKRQKGVL